MHSLTSRLNALGSLLSTCTMCLVACIALSSLLFTPSPSGLVNVSSIKVQKGQTRRYPIRPLDVAFVQFNITADLTSLFHWNTKQVFVYLEAEYNGTSQTHNDVVIWDRIIRRKKDAVLKVRAKNKYILKDLSSSFGNNTPADYVLKYNVMPWIGALQWGEAARTAQSVAFPAANSVV